MLTVATTANPEALTRALMRAGFHAVDIWVEGDDLIIHGTNPNREDEWGGHAMLDEADRAEVEAVIASLSDSESQRARARELRDKPGLNATEQSEAIRLLLKLATETD